MAGGNGEYSNGNGSLMRIAPLVFYVASLPEENRWDIVREVSSITHRHIRSVVACCYLVEFLTEMLQGLPVHQIYTKLQRSMPEVYDYFQVPEEEQAHFDRLVNGNIHLLDESHIKSSGYVVHTLEASIYCLLTTDNYRSAVLKAVNLGDDSDTTGAVTGALAGLYYGMDSIPESWLYTLARSQDILRLALRYAHSLQL
jgi:ADP-ribosyl-[dinitrogen reductase] hydrolase